MEPATLVSAASPIIQRAAELAKSKLDTADQLAAGDAKRYVSYLEAALAAIRGLENGYIDILVEAMHCRVDQAEQMDHLATRIEQHLWREALRPHLVDAIARLEKGREALAQHADRVFLWPGVKKGRADALAAYDKLLSQLRSYINQLGAWYGSVNHPQLVTALRHNPPLPLGGSGVNVEALHRILASLARRDQEQLSDNVTELLSTLTSDRHLRLTQDIARVVEGMLITFR